MHVAQGIHVAEGTSGQAREEDAAVYGYTGTL